MIDINKYIKEILKYEESVIIEGLGTFIAKYQTAEIKSKKGSISPPTKIISFDDRHKKDNGRLIEFIIKKEDFPREVIRSAIIDFSAKTLNKLDSGEHVHIDELGYLYKDKAYKIQFVQDASENIFLETFGLQEIEWDMEKEESTETTDSHISHKPSRSKLIIIPISILVIAILVFSILISDKIKKSGNAPESRFGNLFSKETKQITKKSDSRKNKREIAKDIDSITDKQNALYFEENKYSTYKKFYLIAGSFSIYKNAEKFKHELDALGYQAEILEVDGKIFRVSMKSFINRNEAVQELHRLQTIHKDHTLWILNAL